RPPDPVLVLGYRRNADFPVAGYSVTLWDCCRSPPIHRPAKQGFCVDVVAVVKFLLPFFLDIFSTINYFLHHECKFFTRGFSSEFFSGKFWYRSSY
ncbi:MAG TPA: hypothetical protein PKI25_04670, partial [Nitrosomonas europaea]|nr:hypothetical protein [Nitrosomonas europaea]